MKMDNMMEVALLVTIAIPHPFSARSAIRGYIEA